jgi:energy-coupling factor transporter transmembrane protein EcfT
MAELTSFGYMAGNSSLHRTDARFKIFCIIFLSLVSLNINFGGLGILTAMLLGAILHARLPLLSGFKELRYFSILLLLIFVARVLSSGGPPVFSSKYFSVSTQGLWDGILVCWRLALIVVLGFIFVSTTPPSAVKAAVQWFLKPVPYIPEKKVAVMMGLILRFVPVILNQARETSEAQKARGVENRRNPVYRLTKLGFPLLRRTFERADDLVVAMEARCFTENRTDPEPIVQKRDWVVLVAVCCLGVTLLTVSGL